MRPPAATATTAILPALPRLRGLATALAGFAAVVLLALLADQALHALGLPPPAGQPLPEFGRQALASWLRAASHFACGVLWSTADQAARSR